MSLFKKISKIFHNLKVPAINPMNQPINYYTYSTSTTGTLQQSSPTIISNNTYQSFNPSNSYLTGQTVISDGTNAYNILDVCKQFEKLQKTSLIAFAPIDELALLLTDEDQFTREMAALFYEKFQKDFATMKRMLEEEK